MGLFGNIFHEITQPITRLTGKYTPFIAPAVSVTGLVANLADKIVGGGLSPHGSHPTQTKAMMPVPTRPPSVPYAQGGSYFQPQPYYGGGGGFAPSYDYPPAQPFYGGSPWDFSTPSQVYSTPQYQTYSAPPGSSDRTWEDLASLAPVVASFL